MILQCSQSKSDFDRGASLATSLSVVKSVAVSVFFFVFFLSTCPSACQHLNPPSGHGKGPNTKEYGHIIKETEVTCFVSCRASSVILSHREKGGNDAAPKVRVVIHKSPWIQQ